MRIRQALPDELAAINAVHHACGRQDWDATVLSDPGALFVAVALVDDTIVGAGKTHFQAEPERGAPAGYYLGGVSVHPDHRRRGVGFGLTRARIDWVWERSDTVYYFTDDTNVASMRLHASFGFTEIARLPPSSARRRATKASYSFALGGAVPMCRPEQFSGCWHADRPIAVEYQGRCSGRSLPRL